VNERHETTIQTTGLTKRYGEIRAVDGLDLHVRKGEIYGFLGRNGAGKTTTIRMLLGLVKPTSGEATILGTKVTPDANAMFERVGYLVETATTYANLTVRENLEIQRRLTRSSKEALARTLDQFGLTASADRRAGHLSMGNKQRLSLARALLHKPDVLLLDEPANGLDPAGIIEIRQLLRKLADESGITIFMSSHILAEVAHLADRIGIVHEGKLIEELDYDELQLKSRAYLEVAVNRTDEAETLLLGKCGADRVERMGDGCLNLYVDEQYAPEIARLVVEHGLELLRLAPKREDLESYFIRLTDGGEA